MFLLRSAAANEVFSDCQWKLETAETTPGLTESGGKATSGGERETSGGSGRILNLKKSPEAKIWKSAPEGKT